MKSSNKKKKNYEIRFRGSFLKRYAWLFIQEFKSVIQPIQTVFEDDETVPLSKRISKEEQQPLEEWNFCKLFYSVLRTIFQKNVDNKGGSEEEENVEETLSYIYTLRYLSSFLLHNYDCICRDGGKNYWRFWWILLMFWNDFILLVSLQLVHIS